MSKLIDLRFAAHRLRVPQRWLAAEAAAGRVPALSAAETFLFDWTSLEAALLRRARDGSPQPQDADGPGPIPGAVEADTGAIRAAMADERRCEGAS
jgi:hypothetical protein